MPASGPVKNRLSNSSTWNSPASPPLDGAIEMSTGIIRVRRLVSAMMADWRSWTRVPSSRSGEAMTKALCADGRMVWTSDADTGA